MMDVERNKDLLLDSCQTEIREEFKFQYNKFLVILMTFNAAIGSFFCGCVIGEFDTIQINLAEMFKWDDLQRRHFSSLISSSLPVGAVFGSIVSGRILNYLGRRKSFILFDVISLVGIGFKLVLNEYSMIFGRFICGLSLGTYSALTSIYVVEFVPYDISGACGAIYECFYCLGVFVMYLLGLNLPEANDVENQWWRFMLCFPGIMTTINLLALLIFFRQDTPRYTYLNNNLDDTRKSLKSIYKRKIDVDKMIEDYQELKTNHVKVTIKEMFGKKYRFRLFLAIVLMIAQQACGIDALLMYSDAIFIKNVPNKNTATFYTNMIGISQVLSSFVCIFIIEKLGRKPLLITGLIFMIISQLMISLCYSYDWFTPVIYLFIFFTFCNGISLNPVSYIYAPDVLPENGMAIAIMMNYIFCFTVTQSFLFLEGSVLEMQGTILIYASFTFIALIISIFWLKETRGLSAYEIEQLFEDPNEKITN
jgi:MFS family permease